MSLCIRPQVEHSLIEYLSLCIDVSGVMYKNMANGYCIFLSQVFDEMQYMKNYLNLLFFCHSRVSLPLLGFYT